MNDDHCHRNPDEQECIADGLGDVLHAANGEETAGVANPPVTNVPWSNFDGQSGFAKVLITSLSPGEHLEGGEYWEIEEVCCDWSGSPTYFLGR